MSCQLPDLGLPVLQEDNVNFVILGFGPEFQSDQQRFALFGLIAPLSFRRYQTLLGSERFFADSFNELSQRLTAMANSIFLLRGKFRSSFAKARQKKVRIVPKSAAPARAEHEFTMPGSIGDKGLRIVGVAQEHNYAVIVSFAVGLVCQHIDQLLIISLV